MPYQKAKDLDRRQDTPYKGKAIDSSQASTSKFKMSYGGRPQFIKGNTHMNDERIETSWRNNFHVFTSRNPPITCYYCRKVGDMKIGYRKRMNDLKAK